MKRKYMADFETAVWNSDETYVWAYAFCEIGNESNIKIGNNIEEFMEFCEKSNNSDFYFHNLKFDGEFIISYLLENGFKFITDKKYKEDKTFTSLISDTGVFYSITVYFKIGNKKDIKVNFFDSLKIIPFPVEDIPKYFGLPDSKLKIDYKQERERGHELTKEEKDYVSEDVIIVSKALNQIFQEGLTKMTRAGNALDDYKKIIGKDSFKHYYPSLDENVDKDIRRAYRGGFTYLNPIYKNKVNGETITLDVNSLYPWAMYSCPLPWGEPYYFEGKYEEDEIYPLYVQQITCSFELKKNKIPMIQIKNNRFLFNGTEYLRSSNNEIVSLILTNVDLKLFFEQYEVYDLHYINGYKFKSIKGRLFKEYIDKWTERKIEAGKSGNKGQRQLAKLMLNSLYGKFATSIKVKEKIPFIDNGVVRYLMGEEKTKSGLYLPVACFVTAWAREKTIRTSQAITDYSLAKYGVDKYIYSDTDSIKTTLSIEELKQFCDIDDYKLGYWAHEQTAIKSKFIRAKTYICKVPAKDKDGNDIIETEITCAGMPKSCYDQVTFDNFKEGLTVGGKLMFKHVKGGVILVDTEFTIKNDEDIKMIKHF